MGSVHRLLVLLLAFLAALAAAPAAAQPLVPGEKAMAVRLVAEAPAPAAGGKIALALVMTPRPGWHGYWKNPGDAGFENSVAWRLPAGARAGPLHYPVPKRLIVAGIMSYVYEGEYAQLFDLEVPPGQAPGSALTIRGSIDYLVCTDEICVRETAAVGLDLPVAAPGAQPPRNAAFDRWREALPKPLGSEARFERVGDRLRVAIPFPAAAGLADPYFYPLTLGALDHAATQAISRRGDLLIVETKAGATQGPVLEGVLALGDGRGLSLSGAPGPVPAAGEPVAAAAPKPGAAPILLLNIMPCVFPILSLKALSLARAGAGEGAARREALAYTAGVVVVCVALGAALLALRSGGAAVGWAFQLQDPRVILFLLLLVTAIALNLAGLFELPAIAGGSRLAASGGSTGAFWTGALAAFVATPCTGPFMGAAMGAALVLPAAAALAVFAGLGLGLALPFLLLGFVPALRRRLPRPGPWMQRFRRILSVPMFLTAFGLAWILARQAGPSGIVLASGAALVVAGALWWAGRRHGWLPLAPAAAVSIAAIALVPAAVAPAQAEAGGTLGAAPFSESRLAALRAEGKPVFVYFTADWCVTCKVNENAVLARADVAAAFAAQGTAVLVGDWTRADAAIGRFLEKHGRSGVPLYLWYPPGKAQPEILPQILTPGRVKGLAA
jgi:DsbC/DsbD-like thiol-disulfide interchange protein/cytochrome c biogenesis protein CcdA